MNRNEILQFITIGRFDPMESLKNQLSQEWQKPKAKNIRENPHDTRIGRNYDTIHSVHDQINSKKIVDQREAKNEIQKKASQKTEEKTIFQRMFSKKKKSLEQKAIEKRAVKRSKQKKSAIG